MTNDSPQNVAKKLSKMFDAATASAHKVADLWNKLYKNPPKKAQSSTKRELNMQIESILYRKKK